MINAIKRIFCKHRWQKIDEFNIYGTSFTKTFSCTKCGEVTEILSHQEAKWKFEQGYKGAMFYDE